MEEFQLPALFQCWFMIENIKCIFMFPEIQYKVWYYFTVLFNHLAGSGCEFGPGCRFPCHCQGDTSCNLLTGSCSAGCDDGSPSGIHWPGAWEGPGCQIGKDMMTSWHGNTMRITWLLTLCEGNPSMAEVFPSQRDSNAELWRSFVVCPKKLFGK